MEQNSTLQAAAHAANGKARGHVTLPGDLFDGTVNVPVMHQVVKAYLANQRQANASTKRRGLVTGGGRKPWKQKGTGRARQGSTRAPHFVGGGTVFGPTSDRNYEQKVPRQVRVLGRKSALNARAREEALFVIDSIELTTPKTSAILSVLDTIGVADRKVLILTDGVKTPVHLSARNLPLVHVMPFSDASTYHILWSDVVVVESGALGDRLEVADGDEAGSAAPRKRAARRKTAGDTPAEEA